MFSMPDPDAEIWGHRLRVAESVLSSSDFFEGSELLSVHATGFTVSVQNSLIHVFCDWETGNYSFDGNFDSDSLSSFVESQVGVAGAYMVEGDIDSALSVLSSCSGVVDELFDRSSVDEFLNLKKVRVLKSSKSISWKGGFEGPDLDRFCRSFLRLDGLEKAQNELIQDSMGLMILGIDHFVDLSGSYLLSQKQQIDDAHADLIRSLAGRAVIVQEEVEDVLTLNPTSGLVDFLKLSALEIRKSVDFFYLLRK